MNKIKFDFFVEFFPENFSDISTFNGLDNAYFFGENLTLDRVNDSDLFPDNIGFYGFYNADFFP